MNTTRFSQRGWAWYHHLLWLLPSAALLAYGLTSYVALPHLWHSYEKRHPALQQAVRRTVTAQGILGDPINLAFIGTQAQLMQAANAAGWVAADPITWGSSAKIAVDSVVHRAYVSAPVSDLYVWGKKQDLAFEKPFGHDPSRRHHVRFWQSPAVDAAGRPLWLGAATFDRQVGVSHRTGQVTHHIDPDVDQERNLLWSDVSHQADLRQSWLDGFQLDLRGKNGGGDPYFTDGRLLVIDTQLPDPGVIAALGDGVNATLDDAVDATRQALAPVLGLLGLATSTAPVVPTSAPVAP